MNIKHIAMRLSGICLFCLLTTGGKAATARLSVEDFTITPGGEAEVKIDLTNPDDEITLVQFDLRLPAGLSLKQANGEYDIDIADRTTWRKHSLDANAQADGTIRFLLASNSNATLSGTEGAVITMTLTADDTFTGGVLQLENILMVTPDETEVIQENVDYNIGTVGIYDMASGKEHEPVIHSLSGLRQSVLRKGINIDNGKKVICK